MVTRRSLVIWSLALAAPALAQTGRATPEQRARDFMAAYLRPLQGQASPGRFDWSPWMTSGFLGAWTRAHARARREQDLFLGADPILNAQDYEKPGDVRVDGVAGTPDRPAVAVSLRVFAGEPRRTRLRLVFAEDRAEWRITDVVMIDEAGSESSLRTITQTYARGG
jgi:hypothetical protein